MPREHPRYASMDFGDYEYQEFPMMVYPGAVDQKKPYGADGKALKGIVVQSEEERDQVLGLGAYAKAEPPAMVTDSGKERLRTAEDDRLELIAKAEALGLQIDKRWGAARLEEAISQAENPI
jgi:hypothetical protein